MDTVPVAVAAAAAEVASGYAEPFALFLKTQQSFSVTL